MTSVVYTHNLDLAGKSTPFYVGKGSLSRARNLIRNPHHANKIVKHGKENVTVKIWSEHESDKDALAAEVELIAFLKTENIKLTNLTEGGDGSRGYKFAKEDVERRMAGNSWARGYRHTNETVEFLRALWKGKKHKEESKKKIGDSQRGALNHMFGKTGPRRGAPISKVTRDKLSAAGKENQPMTDGTTNIVVPKRMVEVYGCAGWVCGITKKKGWCGVWITNGSECRRVKVDNPIPYGWRLGRK